MGGAFGNMIRRHAAASAGSKVSDFIDAEGKVKTNAVKEIFNRTNESKEIKIYPGQTILYLTVDDFKTDAKQKPVSEFCITDVKYGTEIKKAWKDSAIVILRYGNNQMQVLKSRY